MRKVDIIKSYYQNNMKNASEDFQILGWESEEAQQMRFDMLISGVELDGKRILDVGCGLGNLLEYINSKGIKVEYTGVDMLPEMIEKARNKKLEGKFICTDMFEDCSFQENSYDVIYASGIFNLNLGNNKEFLAKALRLFFELSQNYICFNLLHCESPHREDTYYYFCPDEVIELIEETFQEEDLNIKIVEQYLNNDFTVICSRK